MHETIMRSFRPLTFLGVVIGLAVAPALQAQKLKERMARNSAEVFDYPTMAKIYEDINAKGKATPEDLRKLAFAYKRMGRMDKAEATYRQLTATGTPTGPDMLALADCLRANGKYDEAVTWYARYAEQNPDDARAKAYASNTGFFTRLMKDSTRSSIRKVGINSAEADLGPTVMGDLLLFSSARGEGAGGHRLYSWDAQPYLNVYSALLKGREVSDPMVMRKDVNTRYHDGTASFDSAASRLYFTRNNYVNGKLKKSDDGELKLGIYFSDIVKGEYDQQEWGGVEAFPYNDPAFNTGHPCVTRDGRKIFFASDRPGGQGGTDIWYCENQGSGWTTPQNLGPKVNTSGNEVFPFVSGDSALYFASDGHPGLGGYDNFFCRLTPGGPGNVFNLGYPVNSRGNDHSLILLRDDSTGFLSSDRPGGLGSDDIYGATVRPPMVRIAGTVIDKLTRQPIPGATIVVKGDRGQRLALPVIETGADGAFAFDADYQTSYVIAGSKAGYLQQEVSVNTESDPLENVLVELEKYNYGAEGIVYHGETMQPLPGSKVLLCDANDKVINEVVVGADGHYRFPLEPAMDYRLKVEKDGFFKQSARITTKGKSEAIIKTDFKLFPLELNQVVRLDNIYYDLAKWNIRPDAALELDKLVQTLMDNPTVKIELSSHTDCRGKDAYNMNLSDKRAKSAVDYLISKGIAKDRVKSKGYGETKPVETCECTKCTEDQHQRNRRTEFKVLEK
ncbi:MAG: carboxypeptidase regulatory-like domain-containing protein [Flavobacteriales bacterium]|nr:carboxypeptidase regulatory-like domain-containing protein [Flavobacteriales bacterium]